MATTEGGFRKDSQIEAPGNVSTWTITLLACAYFAFSGISLYSSTGIFSKMFNSIGVELPPLPRLVIATYHFSFPIVFGCAAALVITKQFFVRQRWVSLSITLGTAFVIGMISNEITRALYRPLFDLTEKLSK